MPLVSWLDKMVKFWLGCREIDGHNHSSIILWRLIKISRQPSVIIAHTVPGRGKILWNMTITLAWKIS